MDPKFAKTFQHKIEEHHPIGEEILRGLHKGMSEEGYEPKAPLEPQEAPGRESPYQTLLKEITAVIESGDGKKTPVLASKDLKGVGKKITELLDEYHSKTEDNANGHSESAPLPSPCVMRSAPGKRGTYSHSGRRTHGRRSLHWMDN